MHDMTTMTLLQVSAVVEGSERLADEIGRAGVTPQRFTEVVKEALDKRLKELRSIPNITDVSYAPILRRRQIVYGRLSALVTTYNAINGRSR